MPDSLMAELDVIERALKAAFSAGRGVDRLAEYSRAIDAMPAVRQALAAAEQQQAELEVTRLRAASAEGLHAMAHAEIERLTSDRDANS